MTGKERQERLLRLLDELDAAHAAAAICVAEIRTLVGDGDPRDGAAAVKHRPLVDTATFCVRWNGCTCRLGSTVGFKLLERLCRRPNHFVSHDHLIHDVWDGAVKSPATLRSVVRNLKQVLRHAGMGDLAAAIRGEGRRYGLLLCPRP